MELIGRRELFQIIVGSGLSLVTTRNLDPRLEAGTGMERVNVSNSHSWGTYNGDRRRTGYIPNEMDAIQNPRVSWLTRTNFSRSAHWHHNPSIRDDTVYGFARTLSDNTMDTGSPQLIALNIEDGTVRWREELDISGFQGPLETDDDTIYFNALNGVYAINRLNGSIRWFDDELSPDGGPLVANGEVYSLDTGRSEESGRMIAFDPDTGERRWSVSIGEIRTAGPPTYTDGTVYVSTGRGATIHAIDVDARTGKWVFETDGNRDFQGSLPAVDDGSVFVASQEKLYAIDTRTGHEQWSIEVRNSWNAPSVTDNYVIHSDTGGVTAYDRNSGEESWTTSEHGPRCSPIVINETVYLHTIWDGISKLIALELATGEKQWEFPVGGNDVDSGVSFHRGTLYVNTGGRLFAIEEGREAEPPTANLDYDPTHPTTGEEVMFNGSGSTGEIDHYMWNFAGKLFKTGEQVTHTYQVDTEGNRRVNLLVVDENGHTASTQVQPKAEPNGVQLQITDTSGPVTAGEQLEVSVELTNSADEEITRTIEVQVEGVGVESVDVTLDAGETTTETVTILAPSDKEGEYIVTVTTDDGISDESVILLEGDTPAPEADEGSVSSDETLSAEASQIDADTLYTIGGGGVLAAILSLGGYRLLRGSKSDEPVVNDDGLNEGPTEQSVHNLVADGDEAVLRAKNSREVGDLSAAIEHYTEGLDAYRKATVPLADDADQLELIEDTIQQVEEDRQVIQTLQNDRTELQEALEAAENDLREAIVAHAEGKQTLAKLRYRQAVDAYDTTVEILDKNEGLLEQPISVSVGPARNRLPQPLKVLPQLESPVYDSLVNHGLETLNDIQTADEEALSKICNLETVDDQQKALLAVLANWQNGDEDRVFDDREMIESRRLVANSEYLAFT